MKYVLVGINHKTAPVAIRERLAMSSPTVPAVLSDILQSGIVGEAAVISTCNRVEIYGVTESADEALSGMEELFVKRTGGVKEVRSALYHREEKSAVEHLFRVAASLDSLIVGENQILSQIKQAFRLATENAAVGPYLNRLFHRTLYVAKRVRSETEIGKGQVSVGSVAITLALKIFGSLAKRQVVLLGTGEMGTLVARHLGEATDVGDVILLNRHREKSEALASAGLGRAESFEKIAEYLANADILVTALAAGFEFMDENFMKELMAKRRGKPLFIMDLGVPRNILSAVGQLDDVFLYNIDDLQSLAEENRESRSSEMLSAESIVVEETRLFCEKFLNHEALPAIASLNKKFDEIRRRELEKTLGRLPHLSVTDVATVEAMTRAIVGKILHDPILHLKHQGAADSRIVHAVKTLFGLSEENKNESKRS